MTPLVSIIIPVYNCQTYVLEAVESVLAQDYPAKQVIVIDDGSTDGSIQKLQSLGDAIELICVPNGGPARARNTGIARARGEFIAFLDADDVWLPGKLTAQVTYLESHPEVGICYTGWHVWPAGAQGRFDRPAFAAQHLGQPAVDESRSGWIYGRLLFDCELLTTTVMLRAETARRVGSFEPGLIVGEDYDFWLRMAQAAKIARLDCVGALYRVLPTSASRVPHSRNYEHEVISAAMARFGLRSPDGSTVPEPAARQRLDQLTFQHGYMHLRKGNPQVAIRAFGRMLRRQPWRLRLWGHAACAVWRSAWFRPGGKVVRSS